MRLGLAYDTVYRTFSGGRYEYHTYSEGRRTYVSESWALRGERRGSVKIIRVD